MTPEEQLIAIAELCPDAVEWHDGLPYWKGAWSAVGEGNEHLAAFDPLNDLNAIHEAEKTLTIHQSRAFALALMDITNWHPIGYVSDWDSDCRAVFGVAHANSAQRAEALLKAIRKSKP